MSDQTKPPKPKRPNIVERVINLFFKSVFVYRLPLVFLLLLIVVFLYSLFIIGIVKPTNVPLQMTNFGFAVLLGISSICFSWVRTFDAVDNKVAVNIRHVGELSLLDAVLFLIGSILNYMLTLIIANVKNEVVNLILSQIIKWTLLALFVIAASIFAKILARLLLILRKRYLSIPENLHDPEVY